MISSDVQLGAGVLIHHPELVNLYGCSIGDNTKIGAFVEIQRDVTVGRNCKVSSHSFLCSGLTVGDGVFIGHGVMFINDVYPRATTSAGALQTEADWQVVATVIADGASIGSNATIMAGVRVGTGAMVGAGALVLSDVPDYAVVAGVPARLLRSISDAAAAAHHEARVEAASEGRTE